MDISEFYMSRCLELASNGRGSVAPNPMVGAILVLDNTIIGEGFHRCFGEAHAEANAIFSVKDETLLRRATLYVNLEPCSHQGKNPSCAELIIRKAIPRVVVACIDPNPKVAGRGIRMMREAGVDVKTDVMKRDAIRLNRFFMTAHLRRRPYIILKWAQSEDGFLDRKRMDASEKPVVFSNDTTRMMAHQLRSEVQAIMVGTNTAVLDNPALTVRYWSGKSPVRILVDRQLRVPQGNHLLDGRHPTLVFTEKSDNRLTEKKNVRYHFIDSRHRGNEGLQGSGEDAGFRLSEITDVLFQNDIQSLLVEGGAQLHRSFLEEDLWDEIIVETAPVQLKEGVKSAFSSLKEHIHLAEKQCVYSGLADVKKTSMIERYFNYNF